MNNRSTTSPQNMRMILETVRYLRNNGFVLSPGIAVGQTLGPETPVFFRNDSGVEIPPFACMQSTGTVESGGQNYVTVGKPVDTSGAAGAFFFNGIAPVDASGSNRYGICFPGPFVRAYKNTGSITSGGRCKPTVGQWYVTIAACAQWEMVGSDDIAANVMRINTCPQPRLYRFTLNESLADGTADADIIEMDGTDTGFDATIRDPEGIFTSLTSVDTPGLCVMQDGNFYIIQAKCP